MPGQDVSAKTLPAIEIAAGLRARVVDRAQQGDRVEGDAGAVATLVHAAGAGVLGDVFLGHVIARAQFDHQVAAAAAAGARGKVGVEIDGEDEGRYRRAWR